MYAMLHDCETHTQVHGMHDQTAELLLASLQCVCACYFAAVFCFILHTFLVLIVLMTDDLPTLG